MDAMFAGNVAFTARTCVAPKLARAEGAPGGWRARRSAPASNRGYKDHVIGEPQISEVLSARLELYAEFDADSPRVCFLQCYVQLR